MHIIERPLFDRSAPHRRVGTATIAIASAAALAALGRGDIMRPPVVGGCGDDWMQDAKRRAMACMPGGLQMNGANNACPGGAIGGDPCNDPLQEITVGGQQAGALAAAAAFSITVTLQIPFKPLLISIPDTVAPSVKITSLLYGPDNMLKASMMSGGSFSNKNTTGGYKRPGKWLYPGMTITMAGTAVAAIAADTLLVDFTGLTPA